jgi:hypothetical protein
MPDIAPRLTAVPASSLMNWLLSFVIAFLTGVAGLFGTAFLTTFLIRWFRISSFEGGSGYYAVAVSILGGIAGLFVGLICARVVAAQPNPGFLKALGVSLGTALAIILVVALICRLCADIAPRIGGKSLKLLLEIQAPSSLALPLSADDANSAYASIELRYGGKSRSGGSIDLHPTRRIDGRRLFTASFPLQTSARAKLVRVFLNRENNLLFDLPLPSKPTKQHCDWSEWAPALSENSTNGSSASTPQTPGSGFLLRYRVAIIEPPPPPPSSEEIAAKREAREQAEFNVIPADAPIPRWLAYTEYGARKDFLVQAVKAIESRPGLAAELGALINGADHDLAARALRVIHHFDTFPPELNAQVAASGRKIAELIRTFNATPAAQDPHMEVACHAAQRFHAWMDAVRTLRERNRGDFTPELQEILTLSRMRTDSHAMQADIRRVSSFYLKEWAGIDPLPGDPPPR